MRNKKTNNKKALAMMIPSLVFVVCSAVPFVLMKQTLDSKLNRWANLFNDYYSNNVISREKAPMIRIQSNDKNTLQDLYANYYYTNSSTVNYSFRQFYPGKSQFTSYLNNDYSICLNKQTGFTIHEKYDWGYYLDNGLFSTYFKDEVLPNKGYWVRRYNSNGVCFISDTLADKLVVEYGIVEEVTDKNRIEAYEKLIKPDFIDGSEEDPDYLPLLGLKINDEKKDITFCINNILYSEYRTGPRVQQLYGDFCVMFGDPYTDNQLKYCAEFDMKNDIYGNSSFMRKVNALGYDKNNSTFDFYRYNDSKKEYEEMKDVKLLFESIDFSEKDTIFYVFSVLISICCVCFAWFWKKEIIYNLIFISLLFAIYNLVLSFFFIEPLCNLFATINFLAFLIIFGIRFFYRKKNSDGILNYEKISI